MTKFTAIPTILYRKLISQNSGYDDALNDRKSEILSTNLPPELKARFYQDVIRNIVKRKEEEERKPVLVKGYDTTQPDPTSDVIQKKIDDAVKPKVTTRVISKRKKTKRNVVKKTSVFNADEAKPLNLNPENYYDAFEEFAETPQTNQSKKRKKLRESIQTRSYTKKKQPPKWIEID